MATRRKMDVNDISDHVPGLYITGTITNRTRRYVSTRNNMNTEIVTYTIMDEHEHRYFVDDFAPSPHNVKLKSLIFLNFFHQLHTDESRSTDISCINVRKIVVLG